MIFFYSDMKPLSKYSPVTLQLSPTSRILNENPAKWGRELEGLQLSPSLKRFMSLLLIKLFSPKNTPLLVNEYILEAHD